MNRIRRGKEVRREKDSDLFKTVDSTFDTSTSLALLYVMRKLGIEVIMGAIASGKEAKVYPAKTREENYLALKVYYTSTASHKKALSRYIAMDSRHKIKATSTKDLIYGWARKEFGNLKRLYEAGVSVPKPYLVHKNLLVMEFLGHDGVRAPLLFEYEDITQELYEKVLEQITLMIGKAKMVHSDLSEYNIMVFDSSPVIIDVGQSIQLSDDPNLEFLNKDLKNINRFFSSRGINVRPVEEILNSVLSTS
ncbi:serine protein kinase RIO [Metallosphaera tengchongensis]|uniref:non-specific serine/threonine protein kinase n=1 Tax=Metallosphaera tengchongensis TaxID=1532350 RepID=A0A6N0NWB9_9CREN|nr:serine protein kinase RIO [Metallosphaera tengchongensis]QKR00507.1 serine protein kinase RIO [Metallosphaera tengchongensis]